MRAYLKLDILLKIVNKLQDAEGPNSSENCYNAMWFVDEEMKTIKLPMKNMVKAIGVWIPLEFVIIFVIGIVTLLTGIWDITM